MKDLLLSDIDSEPEMPICVTPQHKSNEADMSEESKEMKRLESQLDSWVKSKGFIKKGITIEELAVKFDTNRTYLSSLINSTYKLSFREWIAMHRVEYAKELLLANPEMLSSKIAEMVGYSPNAFTTIFTKAEKMSPTQWRNSKA